MKNPLSRNIQEGRPRILGITLARGGSKSVAKKNIREVNQAPLLAYTVTEALKSRWLTRYIVSSDDDDIRRAAIAYGAEAPFRRPADLSEDTTSALAADQHAVTWAEADEGMPYDYVVELMCTNPMKTVGDIDAALEKLITTGADSVIGVTHLEDHHPIRIKKIVDDRIEDFCLPEIPETRRQDLKPDAYIRNGAIYSVKRDLLMSGSRYGTKESRPHIMPADRSVNVDTEMDLLLAEHLLRKYGREAVRKYSDEEARAILQRYQTKEQPV